MVLPHMPQLLPPRGGRLPAAWGQCHPNMVLSGEPGAAERERRPPCRAEAGWRRERAPYRHRHSLCCRRLPLQVPSVLEGSPAAAPKLFVSNLEEEPLRGKALSFSCVAGSRGVSEKSVDTDVVVAEVAPQVLASLQAMLTELYIPLVASQQGGRLQAEAAKEEFIQVGAAGEPVVGGGGQTDAGFVCNQPARQAGRCFK